jgi:septum formation protein
MKFTNIHSFNIILASQSPRRKQLLEDLGLRFTTVKRDIPENYPGGMHASAVALYLSELKAHAFDDLANENTIIVSADTIVSIDDRILGKPADHAEAIGMLQMLSGRSHEVISGVTLRRGNYIKSFAVSTEVYFKKLKEEEIIFYVSNYHPMDKAGAYGIQEWIGLTGIEKIVGSYYNVVGLPVKEVYEGLIELCNM